LIHFYKRKSGKVINGKKSYTYSPASQVNQTST